MKIKLGPLAIIAAILALIIVVEAVPPGALRIAIGFLSVLFLPGYAFTLAVYPRRSRSTPVERVALSLGLSFAVVALDGLILNYLPGGITQTSLTISLTAIMLGLALIAWIRQSRLPEDDRFAPEVTLAVRSLGKTAWDKTLSMTLAAMVLAAIGTASYVLAFPNTGQSFSEFYILGAGKPEYIYPSRLTLGQEVEVVVGIANHEHRTATYRFEVRLDGDVVVSIADIELQHDEKWENRVAFAPKQPGDGKKVEFVLFKDGSSTPSMEPLRLWIDVDALGK